MHLLDGPDLGHNTEGLKKKKSPPKAQQLAGIKPMASRVLLRWCVLYRCATAAAHVLMEKHDNKINHRSIL